MKNLHSLHLFTLRESSKALSFFKYKIQLLKNTSSLVGMTILMTLLIV